MNNNFRPYQKFAESYDQIYGENFYRDYADFIASFFKQRNNIIILDIACGTGSLIKKLREKQFQTEGLDNSKEMLLIAKEKNPGVKFYLNEFVKLNLKKKYNCITCTFDSINYLKLKDIKIAFENIRHQLKNNGYFIFDFNTNNKKINKFFKINNASFINVINGKYWTVNIQMDSKNGSTTENHVETLFSQSLIKKKLIESNFKIINVLESFNKPASADSEAGRLIVVAQKI